MLEFVWGNIEEVRSCRANNKNNKHHRSNHHNYCNSNVGRLATHLALARFAVYDKCDSDATASALERFVGEQNERRC